MQFDQSGYEVRFEWGLEGAIALAHDCDVLVIVDVMSFTTCVSVAVDRGAIVYPARGRGADTTRFAASVGAAVAGPRTDPGFSLSPVSFVDVVAGSRVVLPSPNGSTIALATSSGPVYAGSLRNARAVAEAAMRRGSRVAVIAAGERWRDDGSLRPAYEDVVGAGAIIARMNRSRSPEAQLAAAAFVDAEPSLSARLCECASGRELREMGFAADLALIVDLDSDDTAPILIDGAFRRDDGRAFGSATPRDGRGGST